MIRHTWYVKLFSNCFITRFDFRRHPTYHLLPKISVHPSFTLSWNTHVSVPPVLIESTDFQSKQFCLPYNLFLVRHIVSGSSSLLHTVISIVVSVPLSTQTLCRCHSSFIYSLLEKLWNRKRSNFRFYRMDLITPQTTLSSTF